VINEENGDSWSETLVGCLRDGTGETQTLENPGLGDSRKEGLRTERRTQVHKGAETKVCAQLWKQIFYAWRSGLRW
jgi:hypothetical protein